MEIILQKDVRNLGKAGDRIKVKAGFARNYLLPNKMALVFDERKSKEWEHKKYVIEKKKKKALLARQASLTKIEKVTVTFERESRSEGLLFGSVTPFDISKQLEEVHKLLVDKKDIKTAPLKEVGVHKVLVELDAESKTDITVEIKRKTIAEDNKPGRVKRFFSRLKKDHLDEGKSSSDEESNEEEKENVDSSPLSETSEKESE